MIGTKHTLKILLAVTCCLFIVLVPLSVSTHAQNILQKGAQGVQKGVETGVDKTKEGAEAVKKGITGEDTSTSTERMKGTQQTTPSTEQRTTTSESQRSTTTTGQGNKGLPRTAGELPLLALVGVLALGAAGASRVLRRVRE